MKVQTRSARLDEVGATAVFVVHDDPGLVSETMLHDVELRFPVLIDLSRETYRRWGLQRTSLARIWLDPAVWRRYAQLLLAGERVRGVGRDTRQLGGDFVVGADGTVTYARPQRRDDRPPVAVLLNELRRAGGP